MPSHLRLAQIRILIYFAANFCWQILNRIGKFCQPFATLSRSRQTADLSKILRSRTIPAFTDRRAHTAPRSHHRHRWHPGWACASCARAPPTRRERTRNGARLRGSFFVAVLILVKTELAARRVGTLRCGRPSPCLSTCPPTRSH